MSGPTEAQLAKLPRWAQDFIASKDRRIKEVELALDTLKGFAVERYEEAGFRNVRPRAVIDYYGDRIPVLVTEYDTVTFLLYADDEGERRIDVGLLEDGFIQLRGSDDLAVFSQSANRVNVKVERCS